MPIDELNVGLIKALQHDDDLVAVMRGHLYVELQVNNLIAALLPFPDELADARLGWPQRIDLVIALGLKAQYRQPLLQLGIIRNKFAHKPDVQLEATDIKNLFNSLHAEDKKLVQVALELTNSQMLDNPPAPPFLELSPKNQFTLIVVALDAILEKAVAELRRVA